MSYSARVYRGHRVAKKQGAAQQKLKRNPGRPYSADANDAREAILQAACRLLRDKLPTQVTNTMIAREAACGSGAHPVLLR